MTEPMYSSEPIVRTYRVTKPDGTIWMETSNESEAWQEVAKIDGARLYRLWEWTIQRWDEVQLRASYD